MFHFDVTMEDIRVIASEIVEATEDDPQVTFHGRMLVEHFDNRTGESCSIVLSIEALGEVLRLACVGDDNYDSPHVQKYQELMADHRFLSIIP